VRAFFGIPIECPAPLRALVEQLATCGADLKVVPPENMHITLKFLGEIPDAQGSVLLERLRAAGFPTQYTVRLEHVGAFPDWKKFNVLWAGLGDPAGAIAASFVTSERVFAELGFPVEPRPFSPHLTVARKRSDRGKEQAKAVLESHRNDSFGEVRVDGPVLFRSHLSPQGPTYERLGSVVA
jgi:RNA 2',3'-cyclic 3'-phosphodiesterase